MRSWMSLQFSSWSQCVLGWAQVRKGDTDHSAAGWAHISLDFMGTSDLMRSPTTDCCASATNAIPSLIQTCRFLLIYFTWKVGKLTVLGHLSIFNYFEIRSICSVLIILHYSVYGNGNATLYSRTKPVLITERKCHYLLDITESYWKPYRTIPCCETGSQAVCKLANCLRKSTGCEQRKGEDRNTRSVWNYERITVWKSSKQPQN